MSARKLVRLPTPLILEKLKINYTIIWCEINLYQNVENKVKTHQNLSMLTHQSKPSSYFFSHRINQIIL